MLDSPRPRSGASVTTLILCALTSFFLLAYPLYVIRPFRPQGPIELKYALAMLQYRMPAMLICIAVAAAALVLYWRFQPRAWKKALAVAALAAACGFAGLSRINVYEKMFHPMGKPTFTSPSSAKLHAAEKVLAVKLGGVARAYPIRSLSYHHIANDMLGDIPIVATY
jgi:hypothetical protein